MIVVQIVLLRIPNTYHLSSINVILVVLYHPKMMRKCGLGC